MKKVTILTEQIINEDASKNMINALTEFENAWNQVVKIWFDDEKIEDAMLKASTVYPFSDNMDELDVKKWIAACIKSIKNVK